MVTREEAMKVAIKYLGEQYIRSIKVEDTFPDTARYIYNFQQIKDSWVISLPLDIYSLGTGRLVCISKKSGQIVYDGPDGGE